MVVVDLKITFSKVQSQKNTEEAPVTQSLSPENKVSGETENDSPSEIEKDAELVGTKESEGNDNDQDTGDVGKGDPDGLAESQQSKTAADAVMEETQVSQPKSDIDQTSLDDDGQTLSQVQIQYGACRINRRKARNKQRGNTNARW